MTVVVPATLGVYEMETTEQMMASTEATLGYSRLLISPRRLPRVCQVRGPRFLLRLPLVPLLLLRLVPERGRQGPRKRATTMLETRGRRARGVPQAGVAQAPEQRARQMPVPVMVAA